MPSQGVRKCRWSARTDLVTIHSDHPFLPPEGERSPLRRFRGRMVAPVSLWTAYADERRVGWTVSSLLVADGPEPMLLGLLDPDADLTESIQPADGSVRTVAVSLLGWQHRHLPDAFAGLAPAPGGPFRLAEWQETPYGPVLTDGPGWLGATVVEARTVGWSTLLTARIDQVELGATDPDLLGHLRGRYLPISS
jgi:flavin reductase (DIM6/NTAB) family NADH-FMN oxidoreductase RutF